MVFSILFLVHLGLYSVIGLSFNFFASGWSLYITLSNNNGLFPRNITSNLDAGILNISSTFNKFLFNVDIFFWPNSSISPSMLADFFIAVVSTVDTPIESQKYSAVKTSVVPVPSLVSQFPIISSANPFG